VARIEQHISRREIIKNMNDSFGDLQPPIKIVKYLKPRIEYNYRNEQKFKTYNCGHKCLKFLFRKN